MFQNLSQELRRTRFHSPRDETKSPLSYRWDNDDVPSNLDSPPSSLSYALRLFKSLKTTISGVVSRETASVLCADGQYRQTRPCSLPWTIFKVQHLPSWLAGQAKKS